MTLQLAARLSHSTDLCGGSSERDEASAVRWCRNPRLRASAQPVCGVLSRNSSLLDHTPIPAYCVLSLKVTVMFNMEHAPPSIAG